MLSPPSTWVPQPGNPNFLIRIDNNDTKPTIEEEEEPLEKVEEKEEPVQKKVKSVSTVGPTEFEKGAAYILYEALAPLYAFVGMLEAESGKPVYFRYLPGASREDKMIPINYGSESSAEFVQKNPHLSDTLVAALLLDENNKEFIGVPIANNPALGTAWVRAQLGMSVFRFLLNSATMGALELAANELEFPLKDLIYSPHVNYMFAQFVAKKFVSPKNNAFAAGINGGQTTYRISSGFNTSTMANTKWLMGCKLWFKNVYYSRNSKKLADIDASIAAKQAEIQAAQNAQRKADSQNDLRNLKNEREVYAEKVLKHD